MLKVSRALILLPIITLFLSSVAFAQDRDSAFGNLADQNKAGRTILSTEGLQRADYLSSRKDFSSLREMFNQAFGTRKTELSDQMLARAKDVLTAKLGATSTYLENLYAKVAETGRVSQGNLTLLSKVKSDFDALIPGLTAKIEAAKTLAELNTISKEINTAIQTAVSNSRQTMTILAVARGEALIDKVEKLAPIVLEHINVAADHGGDVTDVQKTYNSAMLSLESAKNMYAEISALVGDGGALDKDEVATLQTKLRNANQDLHSAYDGLTSVMKTLRVLYSQSPWMIDRGKFEK